MLQRLRHYEINREIGRGSMGVVYEARDSRLGRRVAIKILPPDRVADSGRRLRFAQEAKPPVP
jgi:serine/threonine protein kinase